MRTPKIMLSFKAYLKEAANIPPTNWGYWITPDGKFLVVNDAHHHGEVARDHTPDYDWDKGQNMFSIGPGTWMGPHTKGWVRLAHADERSFETSVSFMPSKVTFRALSQLKHFIMQSKAHTFVVDILSDGSYKSLPGQGTMSRSELLSYLNTIKPKVSRLNEGNLPENEDYGFWLTDTGKFVPVEFEGHYRVASELLNNTGNLGHSAYGLALDKGWFKITGNLYSQSINIDYDWEPKRSIKTKVAIRDFIKHCQATHYFVNNYKTRAITKPEALQIINKDLNRK